MAEIAQYTCIFCENPRSEDGDVLCTSCKEEHLMCFECGQRRRNFPFKLCARCYDLQRRKSSAPVSSKMRGLDSGAQGLDDVMSTLKIAAGTPPKDILPLRHDQNTYKEISEHFKKEWVKLTAAVKKPPELLAIFAIQNEDVFKRCRRYGDDIRKSGKRSNSDLFFHGTKVLCDLVTTKTCCSDTECGVCGISLQGFDEKRIGRNIKFQRFGKGIYLAPNSSKCHDYTQGNPDYGIRAQLLCLVAQGARCELMHDKTALKEAPKGFNSVYGKKGGSLNYDEIVVFDSDAVWPQFVVVYELNGVKKIAD